jgi:Pregnancy-associated plasma protein-A/Secretion system C-terminal sorting domain/Fibronectin type III domain/Bacterial pre-peptidase C-terminal domain
MKQALLVVFAFVATLQLAAQERSCGTMKVLAEKKHQDTHIITRMNAIEDHTRHFSPNQFTTRGTITLPIVIHVLHRVGVENISDAQIFSQIAVLNKDFRAQNPDKSLVAAPFKDFIADAGIEFCLAKRDPSGNATTGIHRKNTDRTSWGTSDDMKKASLGGADPWNTAEYINIWVCNIGGGALGFSQLPGIDPLTDGLVIDYRYFGTAGTVHVPFDRGRTVTHELGHFFNLRHIWGDAECGDDYVADTPQHSAPHFGFPTFPLYSTCAGNPLKLTNNFMDYVNDNCMVMFTTGQKNRMLATLAPNGPRASLVTSKGCLPPTNVTAQAPAPAPVLAPLVVAAAVPPVAPCAVPEKLTVEAISGTGIKLNWLRVGNAETYNVKIQAQNSVNFTIINTKQLTTNFNNLLPDQPYQLQVQSACATSGSKFSPVTVFRTDKPLCSQDIYEPNNSRTYATAVPVNKTFNAQIATIGDADWIRFDVTKEQPNIRLDLYELAADFDLKLYKNDGTQLSVSERSNKEAERIVVNNLPAGQYFARIYGYANNISKDCYAFKLTPSASYFRVEAGDNTVLPEKKSDENRYFTEKNQGFSFSMYPNPSDGIINIDFENEEEREVTLTLLTFTGVVVKEEKITVGKYNTSLMLDYYEQPKGMYLLQVASEQYKSTQKFFIN